MTLLIDCKLSRTFSFLPRPPANVTIAACAPGMRETSIKVRREACTRRVAKREDGVGASRPLHAAGRPFCTRVRRGV